MGDKFSDGAIVQHMSKLRQKMVENNLPVPPPLKRGTTVVPSKIYATSGTARRKSMPDTPTTTSTAITTPKPKGSARKRNRRSHSDSDSDSQVENMDIADSSDGEYGVSGRKKKKQPRQAKSKTAITKKTTMQESMEVDAANAEQVKEDDNSVKSQTVKEETIKESIESPGPATRTRGVRPDYSKLEQASDEEEAAVGDDDKDEDGEAGEDEEAMTEDETEDPKIKSDGEISPRSKVPASPATPAQLTVQAQTRCWHLDKTLTEGRTCLPTMILPIPHIALEHTRPTMEPQFSIGALRTTFLEFHQRATIHVRT